MSKKIFVANWKMNGNTEMIDKFSGSKILSVPNPAATRRESIATGPTASCLDVPKIA